METCSLESGFVSAVLESVGLNRETLEKPFCSCCQMSFLLIRQAMEIMTFDAFVVYGAVRITEGFQVQLSLQQELMGLWPLKEWVRSLVEVVLPKHRSWGSQWLCRRNAILM